MCIKCGEKCNRLKVEEAALAATLESIFIQSEVFST